MSYQYDRNDTARDLYRNRRQRQMPTGDKRIPHVWLSRNGHIERLPDLDALNERTDRETRWLFALAVVIVVCLFLAGIG